MPTRRRFLIGSIASLALSTGIAHAKDDDEGWTRLGNATFDNETKAKDVTASILRGGWKTAKFKVTDADAKIDAVTAIYSSGKDVDLRFQDTVKAGNESHSMSLHGDSRTLKKIRIKARSGEERTKSVVEVWLKD